MAERRTVSIPPWWEATVSAVHQCARRWVANVAAATRLAEQTKHSRRAAETRAIPRLRTVEPCRIPAAQHDKAEAMNRIAPQDIWRSEAFAEDLFEESSFATSSGREGQQAPRQSMLSSTVLCAVPAVVAVLGGVMAFFNTMG